ncbi:AraC family transcriptional regulator [Maricurvus nonylphenolicus]
MDFFDSHKVDIAELAAVVNMDPDTLLDEQGNMPQIAYLKLVEWAADRFQMPHLGLWMAENHDTSQFGVIGFLYTCSSNFGEFCKLLQRYQRIIMTGSEFQFIDDDDLIEARFTTSIDDVELTSHAAEFAMGVMIDTIQTFTKNLWHPVKTCFAHSVIEPENDYANLFGSNLFFNQAHNSFWFERSLFELTLNSATPELLPVMTAQANRLLADIEERHDFLGYVRLQLRAQLTNEAFDMEALAKQLNMTSRTLHRQLNQLGFNFNSLRIDLIMEMAKEALLKSDAKVTDIAQELGYSESSAFVRVFKRNEGMSPLQFRKSHAA